MGLNLKKRFSVNPLIISLSVILAQFSLSLAHQDFAPGFATWYGPPDGPGSGGACGFDKDVGEAPYSAMISAGNSMIFKSGQGCGECYQVQCSASQFCSGQPITITITDQCPGACDNQPNHFDLSGHAFGAMAKPGQAYNLRQLGQIDVQFKRVPCNYPGTNIAFKIAEGINKYYFATAVEYISGDGDIGSMEMKSANSKQWIPMTHSWGAVWAANIPDSTRGPLSFKITTLLGRSIEALNAVPNGWRSGSKYYSNVY